MQINAYEDQFSEPKVGNWQNVIKYAEDHGQLSVKDQITTEKCLQFLENFLRKIWILMAEIKTLKARLFEKDMNIKPRKGN